MKAEDNYKKIKKYAQQLDLDLFGVAGINNIKDVENNFNNFPYAISIGVCLSEAVLEQIQNEPTKLYYQHYRTANMFLDQAGFRIAKFIQKDKFSALAIPASQIIDWQKQKAHISHKHIAYSAGLGWLGRNNLLVNSQFGSQIRLATILTDMPLKVDSPVKEGCASCKMCLTVCPVSAIKERQEDFDHLGCFALLKEFQKKGIVGQYICGICVRACKPR